MSKLIETIPFIGVRGDVLIETRDAKTGKLAQRSEGHNLFTNYGLERFRKHCTVAIGAQCGKNTYFNDSASDELCCVTGINSYGFGLLKYLYLTDNTSAITADMAQIPGTLTGYASRRPYTGTDITRGSININECAFSRGKLKAVFDFATDRANGTHNSVFWADRLITEFNAYNALEDSGIETSFARAYTQVAESSDGYFYGSVGTTLYKIDPTTLAEVASYTLPATPSAYAIFDVNDGIFVFTTSSGSTTLYVFTLSDSSHTTKTLPSPTSAYSGALINGYLYFPYSTTKIYKFNISDGASEYKSVTLPGAFVHRSGSQLYAHGDTSGLIYTYDYATNTLAATLSATPESGNCICNTYSLANKLWFSRTISSYYNGSATNYVYILNKLNPSKPRANMITGRVLETPITKDNTQTMKVTYTISFV